MGGVMNPNLVRLRHGQSTWNLENRFTGSFDCDLSGQGESEARPAGVEPRDPCVWFACVDPPAPPRPAPEGSGRPRSLAAARKTKMGSRS